MTSKPQTTIRLRPEQRQRLLKLVEIAPLLRCSMNAVAIEAVEAGLPILEDRWTRFKSKDSTVA